MEPTVGDQIFVDTNILLAATDRSRAQHAGCREVLAGAGRKGLHLVMSGQVVREYLVVATRPVAVNGLGLAPQDAVANVERILHRAELLEETTAVSACVRELTRRRSISGKRIHDANLIATMTVHGVDLLLTANAADFEGISEVQLVDLDGLVKWIGS